MPNETESAFVGNFYFPSYCSESRNESGILTLIAADKRPGVKTGSPVSEIKKQVTQEV